MLKEAIGAGIAASAGTLLGKVTGTFTVNYLFKGLFFCLMVLCNTLGYRFYLLSLNKSDNSILPTVISSAVNYILSSILGICLFEEPAPLMWWLGAILILYGVGLMAGREVVPIRRDKLK